MPALPPASTRSADPLLQVRGLHFAHAGAPAGQPPLFTGLDLDLPPGLLRLDAELGKTTLLRLLAGDLVPSAGRFTLAGRPWSPRAEPAAVFWLDPRDEALSPFTPEQLRERWTARWPGFDASAWHHHLGGFGLDEHTGKTLHMLSTGSRRKVTLAAALAANAPLTLLDEPTAGLDRPALRWLAEALEEQAERCDEPRCWVLAAAWGLEDGVAWDGVIERL